MRELCGRRAGLLIARRRLIVRRWSLLILLIRRTLRRLRSLLILLVLWTLLHLALTLAHLLATRAHLLVVLIALVVGEDAHDLPSQFAARAGIACAPFGMRLRELIDQRLNALLLIARKVEVSKTPCPMILDLRLAGGRRAAVRRRSGSLILLRGGAERQHQHCGKCAQGQEVRLHGFDSSGPRPQAPERRIRT